MVLKKIINKTKILIGPKEFYLDSADVQKARDYINNHWNVLTRHHPKDEDTLVGVPKPYLVPSYQEDHEFDYDELFYWDSYFMVQGMLDERHKELVTGILEDLVFIFKKFGIVPNASRTYQTGRSQPPFLTSFIFDLYNTYHMSNKWLKDMIATATTEYETVWMGVRKPNARMVYEGLSRYYDYNYINDIAETESGWDMTTRFNRKCLNFLPVDLNSLLYKYEMDFAQAARLLKRHKQAAGWEALAKHRQRTMNRLMWNSTKGLFYDYNFVKERRGNVSSLASYYTMWAGLATEKQAKQMVKNLIRFEQKGGLSATDQQLGRILPGGIPAQWAYPNGWAPLHFIVVEGLKRYGYDRDAKRIAMKWLKTNLDWFNKHGIFLEKYNVAQPDKPPAKGLYPSQTGFGWTNAVFERFCQEFIDN